MSMDPQKLNQLLRDDYLGAEERLRVWTEAAQEALQEEETVHEDIYAMLFWAQTELYRRRAYLRLKQPDIELQGSRALRAIERRNREKREKEDKAP